MPQKFINQLSARRRKGYDELIKDPSFKADYIATEVDFVKEGFPPKMVKAFIGTADQQGAVVSTRVPGLATTQLIEDGHDLKGFFIKAKSCNWGPMAGFLCRHPAFNKKGANGIGDNSKANKEGYRKYLIEKFGMADSDTVFVNRAFVPLKISDTRKKEIFDEPDSPFKPFKITPVGNDLIYGLATDKPSNKATVVMEYLMKKEGNTNLWSIYYGKVYKKEEGEDAFSKYEPPTPLRDLVTTPGTSIGLTDDKIAALKTELAKAPFNINDRGDANTWNTVDGIMNPYPPVPKYLDDQGNQPNPQNYINAVSGDYDLFAVWPAIPRNGFRNLIRISEDPAKEQIARAVEYIDWDSKPAEERYYFQTVPGKALALEITKTPGVFLEFVPDGAALGKLENLYKGNVNEAVENTVGTLNSLASGLYPKANRNVAFHSDEGGRPGIDEIEYPVAFFLPPVLAQKYDLNPCLMIKTHLQFLALILFLQEEYFIPIQWGWWRHWFAIIDPPPSSKYSITEQMAYYYNKLKPLAEGEDKEKLKGKLAYWAARKKENLDVATKQQIENFLRDIVVPYQPLPDLNENDIANLLNGQMLIQMDRAVRDTFNKTQNDKAFEKIKTVFWEIAAADQLPPLPDGKKYNYEYWKDRFENLFPAPATSS